MSSGLILFALFDVGGPEVLVIMFIILLLFGGQRLPELAKGLGKSIREFKKAAGNVEDEFKRAIEEAPEPAKPSPQLTDSNSPTVPPDVPTAEPTEEPPPGESRTSD